MAVYDDQQQKQEHDLGDEHLRRLTGINPEQEEAMNREAYSGAAADMEDRVGDTTPATKADKNELSALAPTMGDDSGGSLYNPEQKKARRARIVGFFRGGSRLRKYLIGAGGVAGLGILSIAIIVMFLLSALKLQAFAQLLSFTGFSRFNAVMQERTAQNIFDASLVEGEGTVPIKGRTLIDRLRLRNIDSQIAALGRDDKLKFTFEDGKMVGWRTGDQAVTLDSVTRQLGFGDNFASIGEVQSKFWRNPIANARERVNVATNWRKVARVRYEFANQTKTRLGNALELEPRAVRSRTMSYVFDNIGFKWGRWSRQLLRKLVGKKPAETNAEERVAEAEDVSGESGKRIALEDGQVKGTAEQMRNYEKLKAFIEEKGGTYDSAQYAESVNADIARAVGMQDVLSKVGTGTMIVSLACMANQTFSHVDEVAENNEVEASLMGALALAASSQLRYGIKDSGGGAAISSATKQLDGVEGSSAYQWMIGRMIPYGNNADVPRIRPSFSPFLLEAITRATSPSVVAGSLLGTGGVRSPAIDQKFCDTLLSPGGMAAAVGVEVVGQAVIALLTSGGGTVASEAGFRAVAVGFMQQLASATWHSATGLVSVKGALTLGGVGLYALGLHIAASSLAGTTFSGAEQGAAYGERTAIGTNIMQNRECRAVMYCAPMAPEDAKKIDARDHTVTLNELNKQNAFARYFSRQNPYSLTNAAIMSSPGSVSDGVGAITRGVGRIGSLFQMQTLGRWGFGFTGAAKAYALEAYDPYYGMTQWGFTPDEISKMENDQSYTIAENELNITPEEITNFDASIGSCFDPGRSQQNVEKDNKCSREALTTDKAFRYRLYKLDQGIVTSSRVDLAHPVRRVAAASTAASGNIDPNLPSGTKEELIAQIKATGNVIVAGDNQGLNTGMKRTILAVILKLAQKYKFTITSTTRPGCGCPHGNGSAVDLQNINGQGVPTNNYAAINEAADQFITDAATLLPAGNYSWIGVPNDHYKQIANAILRLKGGSSDLDFGTGPHFHLNVPAGAE